MSNVTGTAEASAIWFQASAGFLCIILILIAVFGNSLVLLAIGKYENLQTETNGFLASLALADLLIGIFVMPISVYLLMSGQWLLGRGVCYLWIGVDVTCCTASIVHICLISVDRYISITNPLRYKCVVTKLRTAIAIAITWAGSAVVGVVLTLPVQGDDCTMHAVASTSVLVIFRTIISNLAFVVPLLLTFIMYGKIYAVARAQARNVDVAMGTIIATTRKTRRDQKATVTLGLQIGIFVLCWLPYFTMDLIQTTCTTCYLSSEALYVIYWLGYSNSCINPILYVFRQRSFSRAFRKLMGIQRESRIDISESYN